MTTAKFYEKHRPVQLTPMSVIELMEKWLEYYRAGTLFDNLHSGKEDQDDFGIETFQHLADFLELKK